MSGIREIPQEPFSAALCNDSVIDHTAAEIAGLVGPNDEARAVEAAVKRALVFLRSVASIRIAEATGLADARQGELRNSDADCAEWKARAEAAEKALRPLAEIADIFDLVAGNRPREGEIMSWIDHRVGERVLTVEALRDARSVLENVAAGLADAPSKIPPLKEQG